MTCSPHRGENRMSLAVFFGLTIFNTIAVWLNCANGTPHKYTGIWPSVTGVFLLYCGIGCLVNFRHAGPRRVLYLSGGVYVRMYGVGVGADFGCGCISHLCLS